MVIMEWLKKKEEETEIKIKWQELSPSLTWQRQYQNSSFIPQESLEMNRGDLERKKCIQ